METMGRTNRPRRSFTKEFKAEVVTLVRQPGNTAASVAGDLDLTETAVRDWVKQADIDDGMRDRADQRRAGRAGPAPQGGEGATRGARHPQACDGFLREGDPVSVFPFIEAEKAGQRNVATACCLLEVSRSAFYEWHKHVPAARQLVDDELAQRIQAIWEDSKGTYGWPRVHRSWPATASTSAASGSPASCARRG